MRFVEFSTFSGPIIINARLIHKIEVKESKVWLTYSDEYGSQFPPTVVELREDFDFNKECLMKPYKI